MKTKIFLSLLGLFIALGIAITQTPGSTTAKPCAQGQNSSCPAFVDSNNNGICDTYEQGNCAYTDSLGYCNKQVQQARLCPRNQQTPAQMNSGCAHGNNKQPLTAGKGWVIAPVCKRANSWPTKSKTHQVSKPLVSLETTPLLPWKQPSCFLGNNPLAYLEANALLTWKQNRNKCLLNKPSNY